MKNKIILLSALVLLLSPLSTFAADVSAEATTETQTTKAFFVNLKDGDTVENPVKIVFGVAGLEIAPAGTDKAGTGHFHLLIDMELTDAQKALPIPNDAKHIHYGKGQTETTITLTPGKHTLQLVMGDGLHKLHKPAIMSDIITVTAK